MRIVRARAAESPQPGDIVEHAAVLDALPAQIAVLDAQGTIIAVNAAWRAFGDANGLQTPRHAVGANYLDACEAGFGDDPQRARKAGDGIRSVLRRSAGSFALEYPCHAPSEQRWFKLHCTPLAGDGPAGAIVMHLNITRRKQAEVAVQELADVSARRERLLDTTLSSLPDLAYTFDRDGRFVFANRPVLDVLGLTLDQVVGRTFGELGYPEALARRLQGQLAQVVATNQSLCDETPYTRPSGVVGCFEYVFSPVEVDGVVEYVVGSARDTTEGRRTADALRHSAHEQRKMAQELEIERSKLVAAQRVAKVGSWETDLTTLAVTWSAETHRIHGTDPSTFEPTHAKFLAFVHPEDRAAVDEAFRRSASQRQACMAEHRLIASDGRTRFVEERWQIFFDDDDRPVRAVGTCQDITERKEVEAAARESEAQFRTLTEAMPQMVWIARADGWNTYSNQQWLDYTGLTTAQSRGAGWDAHLHPEDSQRGGDAWQHAIFVGSPFSVEVRIRRADGVYRWWLVRGVPMRDTAGLVLEWIGTCTDIHELKLAELEISRTNAALRQSEVRVKYLNRVYAMLSGINTLIIRVSDRAELFREACRIAVEAGGFRMSLIGIIDRATMRLEPVASAGKDDELMAAIRERLASDDGARNTMVARAIREKRAVVANDSQSDPQVAFGGKYASSGVRSMVVLPLLVKGEAVGVIALYAGEIEFFHDDELKLLRELADDVAFGIDHLDKQERQDYLAHYDVLTGLANRNLFLGRVAQYLKSALSNERQVALCLVDLERFKNINDTLGQPAGDALLCQVGELLVRAIGDCNLVARVGADHFAVVLPEIGHAEEVARLIERTLHEFIGQPFTLKDNTFRVGAKVGIALFPNDGNDADALFRNAEAALKKAKTGGERYLFFTQAMTAAVSGRLTLENQLRQALEQEQFVLHYQPKVSLATGRVIGAEALLRWNDPRTGLVPPGRFIPVLEEIGLIHEVGRWALRQAVADYLRWRKQGQNAVRIAVNVSSLQLRDHGFIGEIAQAVAVDACAAGGLELEITESMIMADVRQSTDILRAIRAMGVIIAIDDFGTGFSSLGYLSKLPVDTLKIDRSFVSDMGATPEGLALVSTVITLAHSLKLNVVAEGVETEEQARLLRLLACDEMQGFLFSKPVPAEEFEARFLAIERTPDTGARR